METCVPYKIIKGERVQLDWTGDAWSCSEGDLITIETQTSQLPVMQMAGRVLPYAQISSVEQGYCTKYEMLIDTWAGRTTLHLLLGDKSSQITFHVKPHRHKIGQDEFDAMLHELAQRRPEMLWGFSPGEQSGALSRSSPAVVHAAVVNSQLPLLQRLFLLFVADPPQHYFKTRDVLPLDLTRRVDLRTARWLSKRPLLLDALKGNTPTTSGSYLRTPIDQPRSNTSLNHPVTRYFLYLTHRLIERFSRSSELLRAGRKRTFGDKCVEAHAETFASSLDEACSWLRHLLGQPPFRSLSPEPPNETVLQLLVDHPLFGAINRAAQLLLSPGLAYGPNGDVYASLKPTYDLFELFVLFRIVDDLKQQLGYEWQLHAKEKRFIDRREDRPSDGAIWQFRGPNQMTLELHYQPWFNRVKTPTDGRRFTSLSGLGIPDYVLLVRKKNTVVAWVILDAKYRSGRQAVDKGLGDVHRYRDALRVRATRANGAFVIVPRLENQNELYSTSSYHDVHAFGVLQLFTEGWLKPALTTLGLSQLNAMPTVNTSNGNGVNVP